MNVRLGNIAARDSFYPYSAPSKHFPSILESMTDKQIEELAKKENIPTVIEESGVVVGECTREQLEARLVSKVAFRELPGNRITEVGIPGDTTLAEAFQSITHPTNGLWFYHSAQPPAWVESDSSGLAQLLSEHFKCPVGRPDGWGGSDSSDAPASVTGEVEE